jgi:hypothetical protein
MNINLELGDEEIKYLKWFKTENRPILNGYHPIVYHLEYLGILLTTELEENGKHSNNTYILPSGIGKMILEML